MPPSVVSVLETWHQTFCKNKLEGNSAAEQQQCHKRQKQMKNNDGGGMMKSGDNSGIALPCTRSLAVAHNNLALVLVT